jgi:glycosyltransferase involved in cell wall biosynthesis
MKIVIWQSVLTEHQAHTLKSLESLIGEPIEYVLGARELLERKQQGWTSFSLDNLSVHELPEKGWWGFAGKILLHYPDAIHLFCGLWADRRFFPVMLRAQWRGLKTALMMEPFADTAVSYFGERRRVRDQLKHLLRPILYFLGGHLVAARTISFFPISSKAVDQFSFAGFQKDRIFPFGYFVPPSLSQGSDVVSPGSLNELRLVFVGSLIERKGLPVLFDAVALARQSGAEVSLDVFGPGDPAIFSNVPAGVVFRGSVEFGKTQQTVANYDLLVLPSLHDGWGVVVNESLLAGVPVIVSDAVGAHVLVKTSGAGAVFPSNQSDHLGVLLIDLARDPERLGVWRSSARNFRKMLLPETAAQYLEQCLRYADGADARRPESPWYCLSDTVQREQHQVAATKN